jgi:PhnB protein
MKLNPYLNFPGTCVAAFQFYEQYLGGKMTMTITFADSPLADEVLPEWRGKILRTRMMVGDVALMGGDELPEGYIALQGFNVTLNVEQAAGAERIFAALSKSGEGTTVTMRIPLRKRLGVDLDSPGAITLDLRELASHKFCSHLDPYPSCCYRRRALGR